MAYTTIDDSSAHFKVQLYTGDGNTSKAITFDDTDTDMQPDWVWIKRRNDADSHFIYDSVRFDGSNAYWLQTNNDNAQGSDRPLTAFGSDGFTIGSNNSGLNANSSTYVSWNWKAGTSVSGNTTGSGTAKSYTGSVSTDSGFSITSFTGNGTSGHTIPHNLGVAPAWVIVKLYSTTNNWRVGHNGLTSWEYRLTLEATDGQGSQSAVFNSTAPSSSVVTLGNSGSSNGNGNTYIMYSFAEKKGFSKFGSYEGNGNANGAFVYTGFKPAWVLCKLISGSGYGWTLFDNKRAGYNQDNYTLQPDGNAGENTGGGNGRIDILSNGFKQRSTDAGVNANGSKYVYMAFAENPFVNSEGVPSNGR